MDDDKGIKSKIGGATINGEYSSQETKASTRGISDNRD
jgi:hypothetical protein